MDKKGIEFYPTRSGLKQSWHIGIRRYCGYYRYDAVSILPTSFGDDEEYCTMVADQMNQQDL